MNILTVAIIAFLILESLNVLTLYFMPGSDMGNGIGVFNAWEESKAIPSVHTLVKYLVFWVAGTKLIFIALLLVIVFTGSWETQLYAVGALIVSIMSFFWRLFPMIRKEDSLGNVTPAGYSKTLGVMIAVFVAVFSVVFVIALL